MVWPTLIAHGDEWGISNVARYVLPSSLAPFALTGVHDPFNTLPIILP